MAKDDEQKYLEVAVAAPVSISLTYLPPDKWAQPIQPGMRVLVPLGRRRITGYILHTAAAAPKGQQLKKVYQIVDPEPLFPESQVSFYKWIAKYYHHPIGEVIKTALPAGLTQKSGRRVTVSESGRDHLTCLTDKNIINAPWFSQLLEKGELSPHMAGRLWSGRQRRLLETWQKAGWINIISELVGGDVKIKTEICCALPEKIEQVGKLKASELKTIEILKKISQETNRRFIPRKEITRAYRGAGRVLKSLVDRKIVIAEERQVYRDPFGESFLETEIPQNLTSGQMKALQSILPAIEQKVFQPFLLHGITGSGKTEVYLRAAAAAVDQGRSVLVLVPEIALATQLEAHFLTRFGSRVALLHSGLSKGERFDQWYRIIQGEADVVIGARSAVFAPLAKPGLIIVDEEHDSSYKQEEGFRYQARDLAVLRASQSGAVVILGSATPSVTSYYHAKHGKYHLLELEKRVEERPLPEVHVVNMQGVKSTPGKLPVFSQPLLENLKLNLETGEQSLIFLNRRGYANFMICRECGQTVQCRHCQVSLTLHKGEEKLLCHYCGFSVNLKTVCVNCQSNALTAIGVGTERLEHELARFLPHARIARLDRDTCQKRLDYIKILRAVHRGEIDILLGTQMITKGHHFPNVTLVGIVLADTGLGLPDFRAGERTFQLISQVTGRAGRGERPGRVIIQTFQPDHYAIIMAQDHNYAGMYVRESELRGKLAYPPFSRLVNIKIEGADNINVEKAALKLASLARKLLKHSEPEILGPAPAPLIRIRDKYRWQLLIKGKNLEVLHRFLNSLTREINSLKKPAGIRITIDVDPEYMM